MTDRNNSCIRIAKDELEQFVTQIFEQAGLDQEQSRIIAAHLVFANLRGVDSHGVSRVDIYTKRLDSGVLNKTATTEIEKETSVSALINAGNSSGIVVSTKGIEIAVEKAKRSGIGIVAIKNSNHCGMLADYLNYAVKNDCLAIATTNAPSNVAPWGGKEKYFGTNPFSYGLPAGEEMDILFDMSTSIVAKGKIVLAQKNNQQIPLGWAISKDGKATTDPNEALEGLILPVGGYKGYGLTFLVEALSGLLTGAAFGPQIGDIYKDFSHPQNVGQFFFVMRADLFMSIEEFKKRLDQMIREIREVPKLEDVEKILLPGEIEFQNSLEREKNGVPITEEVMNELIRVAQRYGVPKPLFN